MKSPSEGKYEHLKKVLLLCLVFFFGVNDSPGGYLIIEAISVLETFPFSVCCACRGSSHSLVA